MINKKHHRLTRTLLTAGAALSLTAAVHAVTPGQFSHTTEADFADGDAYGTVVTNLGDIKLSSDTTPIAGMPDDVTVIHDVAKVGGATYIAAGPDAKVLKLTNDGTEVVAELPGEQVFCLGESAGQLVVAVSSYDNSRLMVLEENGLRTIHQFEGVKYIWDIVGAGLQIYAATGPEGKVILASNDPNGAVGQGGTVIFDAGQANILTLAMGGGHLYAGTDTDGLVYRLTEVGDKPWEAFVVYDAPEAEVAALAVAADGMLYAGTADANQAKPGRMEQPVKEESGRPAEVEEAPEPEPVVEPEPEAEPAEEVAEAEEPEAAEPAPPTKEQYDALRAALKEQLEVARETGQLDADVDQADGNDNAQANDNARPDRPSRARPATPTRKKPGNAVYRIAPDGFVAEVFRESVMILAVAPQADGKLIVATGNEGQVFSVDPAVRETTVLADLDSAQVTCATATDKGLLLGAANPGVLMRMDADVAEQGGYTSRVLDAGQVSIFGTFKLTADIPEGTTVAVELRSGNVGDPEQAAWSKWTKTQLLEHDADANPLQPREVKLDVPPARYLQYRLTLTGDGEHTPVIDQADLAYVAPNTPPTVAKLVVTPAKVGEPGSDPDAKVTVQWQATDDNQDRLVYSLEYKPGKADRWLSLAEDLTANKYDWQTQHVPDGWYTLRLTAHDKLDNPPDSAKAGGRVSEPVLIDNTAPSLEDLEAEVLGGGKVRLTAEATDDLSAISSVSYSLNGSETYQASLPDDLIYDSTSEPWGVTIPDLSPGGHVIAVRAIDARGNTAYRQLIVNVE